MCQGITSYTRSSSFTVVFPVSVLIAGGWEQRLPLSISQYGTVVDTGFSTSTIS